ncbi:MAG: tetratricopeptide repeat protein [Ignavibacteria bacterium]|jgi:tetratricopeptide (TPR) repeat protein|nr:tetratricopeptide repeat protein [Ignavibacteria bacterium]
MKLRSGWLVVFFVTLLSFVMVSRPSYPQQKQQKKVKAQMTMSKDEVPVTTKSQDARQKYLEGMQFMWNLQADKARASFQDAVQKDPDFALGYMGLAMTRGKFSDSKQDYDKAESLMDKVSEGEKQLVTFTKSQFEGNTAKAKEALDKLLSMFPKDKMVQTYAGNFENFVKQDYDAAISHYQKAIAIDKNFAPAYNIMGYAYSSKNDFKKAEAAFKKYISLIPDNPNPYDSYGELLLKYGKYDESIKQYQKALKIDPNFWSSYEGLGNNYVFKDNFSKARETYQQLFDKATVPNWKLAALFDQATSFVREGDINNALTELDKRAALAEKEGNPVAAATSYGNKGFILVESGKPEEAMKQFDKAKETIESSDLPDQLKKNLTAFANLLRVYGMTAQGKTDEAKSEMDNKDKLIGGSTDPGVEKNYESFMGYLALKQNNYDEALAHFQKGDIQDPFDWYYMSQAYEKKGETDKAAKLVDKIHKSNLNSMNLAIAHYKTQTTVTKGTK